MPDTSASQKNPAPQSDSHGLSAYLPKHLYRYLGYAFLFAWFRILFTSSVLVDPSRLAAPLSETHQFAMAATAVIAFVVAFFAHRLAPAGAHPIGGIAAGIIGSIGTALIAASYSELYSPALTSVGYVVISFTIVWLTVTWQETYAGHGVRTAVILLALSTLLSIVLFFVLAGIPQGIAIPLSILLPLAAGLTLPYRKCKKNAETSSGTPRRTPVPASLPTVAATRRKSAAGNTARNPSGIASQASPAIASQPAHNIAPLAASSISMPDSEQGVSAASRKHSNSWIKRAPFKLLFLVFLAAVVNGAMRTTGALHNLDFTVADQWIGFGISATLSTIIGCAAAFYSHKRSISLAFYIALPAIAIGCIMLASAPTIQATLGQTVMSTGVELVGIIVWVLLIDQAFIRKTPSLGIFALLISVDYAGAFVGQAIGVNPEIPVVSITYLSLLLCLVSALLLVSMQGKLVVSMEALTGSNIDIFELRLETLAREANLSPRETEVMSIWAAGHNSAYIEETLHISKHTVKTHLVHIYEKTGTANREELLSLLEQKG